MINLIQVNCREDKYIDKRQAKAVLKYKPDIILLEYLTTSGSYEQRTKSPKITKEILLKNPWVRSDKYMWTNIVKIRRENHHTILYAVDGPYDLVNEANVYQCNNKNPNKTTNLFWWIRIYLRERFMAENIKKILKNHKDKKSLTILVFLQKFHWQHVKFLLSRPAKNKIWKFYFGRFRDLKSPDVSIKIKKESPILYKYWKKYPV